MTYPVDRLLASLENVTLSNPSSLHENGAHDGYRQSSRLEPFAWVLKDFAPIKTAWLSHIEPGGYIKPHRDAGPWYERWQVPIQPAGRFIVDGVELDQVAGVPFRVEHWKTHEIVNDTDRPRIHLVLDRDVIAIDGVARFELI